MAGRIIDAGLADPRGQPTRSLSQLSWASKVRVLTTGFFRSVSMASVIVIGSAVGGCVLMDRLAAPELSTYFYAGFWFTWGPLVLVALLATASDGQRQGRQDWLIAACWAFPLFAYFVEAILLSPHGEFKPLLTEQATIGDGFEAGMTYLLVQGAVGLSAILAFALGQGGRWACAQAVRMHRSGLFHSALKIMSISSVRSKWQDVSSAIVGAGLADPATAARAELSVLDEASGPSMGSKPTPRL